MQPIEINNCNQYHQFRSVVASGRNRITKIRDEALAKRNKANDVEDKDFYANLYQRYSNKLIVADLVSASCVWAKDSDDRKIVAKNFSDFCDLIDVVAQGKLAAMELYNKAKSELQTFKKDSGMWNATNNFVDIHKKQIQVAEEVMTALDWEGQYKYEWAE